MQDAQYNSSTIAMFSPGMGTGVLECILSYGLRQLHLILLNFKMFVNAVAYNSVTGVLLLYQNTIYAWIRVLTTATMDQFS